MKKKTFFALSSSAATLAFLVSLIAVNPPAAEWVKAIDAEQSCASLLFGTAVTTGSTLLTSSNYEAKGLAFSLASASKVYSDGSGKSAKFGSASSKGSLTFTFSETLVSSIRLYAYQYGSDGAAQVTVKTSAISEATSASILSSSVPNLDDLAGSNIYLFSGLDNGSGASSTSLTIESDGSNRFYLAKILLTLRGASQTNSSSLPSSASSAGSSSSSGADPAATTVTLDSSNTITKTYATGDYGSLTAASFRYGYYRSYQDSGTLTRLIAPSYSGSIPGAFYNIDAIKQITSITLNYKTASSSDLSAKLYAGSSSLLTSYQSVAAAASATTKTFTYASGDNIAYFRLDSGTSNLTIYSLSIAYLGGGSSSLDYGSSGASLYRINPVVYSGSLTSGVSSVSVPTSLSITGSNYRVTASKNYTYFSYAAVEANSALADEAAYTEPADVAAYFTAFGTYPANYVLAANYAAAYSLFSTKTRCVSSYNKTTGYVTALPPTRLNGSVTYDYYYECDIDLTGSYAASSSSPSRGVGRVIVFKGGFSSSLGATGYTSDPVAIFTDDHYATFQEYYNYGTAFSTRFDAEKTRTFYQWGCPNVLTAS